MAEYNLSEFRAQTKKAFDEAERGESVVIERHGEDFYLIHKDNWDQTVEVVTRYKNGKPNEIHIPFRIKPHQKTYAPLLAEMNKLA